MVVHLALLEVGDPYLLGREFSGVDLLLTMLMRWSRNMPRTALEWPSLKMLADLVRARPSWKRLYEIEGITDWLCVTCVHLRCSKNEGLEFPVGRRFLRLPTG